MFRSLPPILPLLVVAGLAVTPAGAHETRVMVKTAVKAEPSSSSETIGMLSPFRRVNVVECTGSAGPRDFCYVVAPGPDGWVRASVLEHPEPLSLPCPPACRPRG